MTTSGKAGKISEQKVCLTLTKNIQYLGYACRFAPLTSNAWFAAVAAIADFEIREFSSWSRFLFSDQRELFSKLRVLFDELRVPSGNFINLIQKSYNGIIHLKF